MDEQRVFQINIIDNVATALEEIKVGQVKVLGSTNEGYIEAAAEIPNGHKIALYNIAKGEDIIKYGIVIGRSTMPITKGSWVHLHVMESIYDQRSSHLDAVTGAPKDIRYE